jgi:hypothetical protein
MRDMLNNKQVVHLGNLTLSGTAAAASAWVDVRDFDACTIMVVNNTVTAAGDSGFTSTVQHSDTTAAADAAAIVAADSVDGSITVSTTDNGDDNIVAGGIGYKGSKRYVRVNAVGTANTAADISVIAVLNKPHRAATTFVGTSVAAT